MENSFKSFVDSASSIIILLPKGPYFDQVAAGLSLYLALSNSKKDVAISSSDPMTVEFNRLIGVNRISADLGNKNLIIKFDNYDANGIEKVSYDIEKGQFVLTVIPKSSVASPRPEQVDLSYAGVAASAIILVGGTRENHFPTLSDKELKGLPIAHIGTKPLTVESVQAISFARKSSSVSELMTNLIAELGVPVSQDIATNLLAGLEMGSDNFDDSKTSSETFMIASELMRAGGKRGAGQATQVSSSLHTKSQPMQTPAQTQSRLPKPVSSSTPRQGGPVQSQTPPMPTTEPEDLQATQPSDAPGGQIPQDWLQNPRVYKGVGTSTS